MSEVSAPKKTHPILRALITAVWVAAPVAAAWVLFRFVVTDEQLLLNYVKVLIWPFVVAIAGYWFREPIKEKLSQLLRVEGLGASAEFGDKRLEDDLQPSVAALLDDELAPEDAAQPDISPVANGTPVDVGPATDHDDQESLDVPTDTMSTAVVRDTFLRLARTLGLPMETQATMWSDEMPPDDAIAHASAPLEAEVRHLRKRRIVRQSSTRENLESVIRTSAHWGYRLGRSGAPERVPDIEWRDDGSWRITTEVPDSKASMDPSAVERRDRQIRQLEEEIRSLERKRPRVGGATKMAFLSDEDAYRRGLKKRLAEVDPGNFWAGPI